MNDRALHILTRIQAWFMVEGSPWPLAIFRVVLGGSLLFDATNNLKRVAFYTPGRLIFPYFDAITPLTLEQITTLFELEQLFAVMLLLGALTPLAAAGVIVTQGYPFLICQLNFRNHIYLALLFTFLVMLSPAGKTFSIDAGLRYLWVRYVKKDPEGARPPRWVPLVTQRLVAMQVFAVYLYATLHKINPGFLTGYPLNKTLGRSIPGSWLAQAFLDPEQARWLAERASEPQWGALVAYLTVFSEGFLAVGLFFPATRLMAVIIGVGLHLSIGLSMNIVTFGTMLVGAYACFWAPRTRPIPIAGRAPAPTSAPDPR